MSRGPGFSWLEEYAVDNFSRLLREEHAEATTETRSTINLI